MSFNADMVEELNLILRFPNKSLMQGLKVHKDADQAVIDAAQRLYNKGIVQQPDGGYLTELGHDLVEHAQVLQSALTFKYYS